MSQRNFWQMVRAQWDKGNFACVGLDSDYAKIPKCVQKFSVAGTIVAFNREIVEATKHYVCAYKPNVAFYEAYGSEGIEALRQTIVHIHQIAPDVPVILDAKRADIGNTNIGSVRFAFDFLQADAITVNPYLGAEALKPFLEEKDKGIIILCKTSNPGSGEFQDLLVEGEPLYCRVARNVAEHWNRNQNCGLVVGATQPMELRLVRKLVGDLPILIPGIGAQGGELERAVLAGMDSKKQGIIISSSRDVIFASAREDYASAACQKTLELRDSINQQRLKGEE